MIRTIKCFFTKLLSSLSKEEKKRYLNEFNNIVKTVSLISSRASLVGNIVIKKVCARDDALEILSNIKWMKVIIEKFYTVSNPKRMKRQSKHNYDIWEELTEEANEVLKSIYTELNIEFDKYDYRNLSSFLVCDADQIHTSARNFVKTTFFKKVYRYFLDKVFSRANLNEKKYIQIIKKKAYHYTQAIFEDMSEDEADKVELSVNLRKKGGKQKNEVNHFKLDSSLITLFKNEINRENISFKEINRRPWTVKFLYLYRINQNIGGKHFHLWPIVKPKPKHVFISNIGLKMLCKKFKIDNFKEKNCNEDNKEFWLTLFPGLKKILNKSKFKFIRQISTNGYDASVVLSDEKAKKRFIKKVVEVKAEDENETEKKKRKLENNNVEKGRNVSKEEKELIENSVLKVGIDPGKVNIISSMNNLHETVVMKNVESMKQRWIRIKLLKKFIKKRKEELVVDGHYRTNDDFKFREYLKSLIKKSENIYSFYSEKRQIRIKFLNYIETNHQVTENVKKIVGWKKRKKKDKDEDNNVKVVTVGFGDASVDFINKAKKSVSSCVGLVKHKLQHVPFRGFKVNFLEVDEFRTSKVCSRCCERYLIFPKKSKKNSSRLGKCNCGLTIDRDINASINILSLIGLKNEERPSIFQRDEKKD